MRGAGLGPKELASADPTVDVGPECVLAAYSGQNARVGAKLFVPKGLRPFGTSSNMPGITDSGHILLRSLISFSAAAG